MKELRLAIYETRRLFLERRTWLFIAAFAGAPIWFCTDIFGLGHSYFGSMSNVFMLQPAQKAVFIGVLAALLLTLLEMQRMTKYRISGIIETATSPLLNQLRQTAAIIIVAAASLLASLCVLLPYTAVKMGSSFKMLPFLASWVFIYFGGISITVLFSSGLFMITRSLDISFIAVGILIAFSFFSSFGRCYLFFWVQTNVYYFSDATESHLQIDIILYTRLAWLLASCAVYVLGLACIRRYGKNLLLSLMLSFRKVILPVLAISLAAGSFYHVYNEPFFDKGPILKTERAVDPDTGIVVYKTDDSSFIVDESRNDIISITEGKTNIIVDTKKRLIKGEAVYKVNNPSGEKQDVPFTISAGLDFLEVYENNVKIGFKKNSLDNFMESVYHLTLTADKESTLRIVYEGSPKSSRDNQTRQWGITDKFVMIPYIYPLPGSRQNFLMDCRLTLPEKLTPIMENTVLKEAVPEKKGCKTYEYQPDRRYWLIAGEYNIEKLSVAGQDIHFIYQKGREKTIRDSKASAVVVDVVRFFSEKFGPLDFKGMPFIIAELDGSFVTGGWGLGNMSVFGEGMFAGTEYKGSPEAANVEGGSGIGVAVHEIAHQWWGWSPDSVYIQEDGQSPWSGEGLTVYSTYLYMKERYGNEYAKREFEDVWTKNTHKMQNAFYLTHLKYANKLPEKDAADIYGAFATTTRYEMMPYLLLKAQKLKGGEDAFVNSLKEISQKYRKQELTYDAFLSELGLTKEDMKID